jgi:hypothetical protein
MPNFRKRFPQFRKPYLQCERINVFLRLNTTSFLIITLCGSARLVYTAYSGMQGRIPAERNYGAWLVWQHGAGSPRRDVIVAVITYISKANSVYSIS